jgi:hypothetical protein
MQTGHTLVWLVKDTRWFATKSSVHPKTFLVVRYATGELCWVCGKVREAWPNLSLVVIKERLNDPTYVTFQMVWDGAKTRLAEIASTIQDGSHKVSVTRETDYGMRIEWPFAFVEKGDFLTFFASHAEDKALRLRSMTVTDPEMVKRVGVLLKITDDMPSKLPWVRVFLYRDEKTTIIDVLLDQGESLHARHATNLQKFQIGEDIQYRGEAMALKNAQVVPTWREVQAAAEIIQKAAKAAEEERLRQLTLADAAEEADLRGDASAKAVLQRAAVHTVVESSSRLARARPEEDSDEDAPGNLSAKKSGPSAALAVKRGAASAAAARRKNSPFGGERAGTSSTRATSVGGGSVATEFATPQASAKSRRTGSAASACSTHRSTAGTASVRKDPVTDLLSVNADDFVEAPTEINDLLLFVMGPKSYSPGREIRWASFGTHPRAAMSPAACQTVSPPWTWEILLEGTGDAPPPRSGVSGDVGYSALPKTPPKTLPNKRWVVPSPAPPRPLRWKQCPQS